MARKKEEPKVDVKAKAKESVKNKAKEQASQKSKDKEKSPFPTGTIFFGWLIIFVGSWHALHQFNYLSYFDLPVWVLDLLLIMAGLKLVHWGYSKGFFSKRKKIFMKYI